MFLFLQKIYKQSFSENNCETQPKASLYTFRLDFSISQNSII